jgi:GTP-binding protein
VDLPGYGFARAAKSDRERLAAAAERYFTVRSLLRCLVLLLDARRDPGVEERMLVDFARSRAVGVVPVATKVDKLGRAERARRLGALDRAGIGPWIPFSATTGEGKEAVIEAILGCARGAMP